MEIEKGVGSHNSAPAIVIYFAFSIGKVMHYHHAKMVSKSCECVLWSNFANKCLISCRQHVKSIFVKNTFKARGL